jgi:hypothetical protein
MSMSTTETFESGARQHDPTKQERPGNARRTAIIAGHVMAATAFSIVPVPMVDHMARQAVVRRMIRKLSGAYGVTLPDSDVEVLGDDLRRPIHPRASKHLTAVLWLLGRRTAGRVTGIIAIRQAARVASELGHRGYLLDIAMADEQLSPLGDIPATEVREAIDRVCDQVGTDPFRRLVELTVRTVRNLREPPIEVRPTPAAPRPQLRDLLHSAISELRPTVGNGSAPHAWDSQANGQTDAAIRMDP